MNGIKSSFVIARRGLLPAIAFFGLLAGCSGKQTTTGSTSSTQPAVPHVVNYATTFKQTESPISEGGLWIGGKTVGLECLISGNYAPMAAGWPTCHAAAACTAASGRSHPEQPQIPGDGLGALGDPQQQFRSILIAGTNGKGSTAATLASILAAAGLRCGLYTSPHLSRNPMRCRRSRRKPCLAISIREE